MAIKENQHIVVGVAPDGITYMWFVVDEPLPRPVAGRSGNKTTTAATATTAILGELPSLASGNAST